MVGYHLWDTDKRYDFLLVPDEHEGLRWLYMGDLSGKNPNNLGKILECLLVGLFDFFLILGAMKAVVSSQLKLPAKMHSSATSSMSLTFYTLKIDFFVFLHFNCLSSKFSFRKS